MKYTKQCLFILILCVVSRAQAALPPQLAPPLDSLTIYSSAAITMGASSIVGGNIQVEAAATIEASSIVGGHIVAGAAVTLGASVIVDGYIEARDAGIIGADAMVGGYLTTGDAATLGANTIDGNIMIGGDLTAGAAILVGAKAVVDGNLRSGAEASAGLGAEAVVRGNAIAGTALTLDADAIVNGDAQAGIGAVALGDSAVVGGNARAGTAVTLAAGARVGGTITSESIEYFTNEPKEPIDDQSPQLVQVQAALTAMDAPAENQLSASMTVSTTLKKGIYHATALTTTAGITLTFDGEGEDGHWLINSDTFIAFGASTNMILKDVTPNSTITWNTKKGYISTGASSNLIGTFFAYSYILTGASNTLKGIGDTCGGLFTTTGAVTLGASNIIGQVGCTAQRPDIPFAIPVLEYRFDECRYTGDAGDVIDQKGNFSGTSHGISASVNKAVINKSLDLSVDNTSDWVGVPRGAVNGLNDFSVSVWFKTSVHKYQQEIFHALGNNKNDDELEIFLKGEKTVYIKVRDDSEELESDIELTNDRWHHLALTRVGKYVCLFIDGVKQDCDDGVASGALLVPYPNAVVIGQEQDSFGGGFSKSQNFEGQLDEFKIFDVKLSNHEITRIYQNELAGKNYDAKFGDGPRQPASCSILPPELEYRFDEVSWSGNSGEVNDNSSQGLDGRAIGNTTTITAGQVCGAGIFDGSGHVNINGIDDYLNTTASISFWIKTRQVGSNTAWYAPGIMGIEQQGGGDDIFWGYLDASGHIRIQKGNGNYAVSDTRINDNNWHHVVLTWNSVNGYVQVFVDGDLEDSANSESGDVSTTFSSIGRIKNSFSSVNFIGELDEILVYNSDISLVDVQSIYTNQLNGDNYDGTTRTCPTTSIHHYEIQNDGHGLTCEPESITVRACTNDTCTTLSAEETSLDVTATGSNLSVTDSIKFTGTGTANIRYTLPESTLLSLSKEGNNSTRCLNGSSTSCNLVFESAGFRFISGNSTTIPNQTSGSVFGDPLRIQAVKDTKGVCTGLFSGTRNINLSQENVDPGGSNGLSFSVNGKNIAKHSSVTPTALSFGTSSIAVIPSPLYNDAGKIRLHANYTVGQGEFSGVKLSGSSNAFWVSPTKLVVNAKSGTTNLNGATATATPTHAAGDDFELTVAAYNAASPSVITPNYSPGKIQLKLTRTGPTLTESVDGKLKYATSSMLATSTNAVFEDVTLSDFSSGVSTYAYAQYSEVGLLKLDVKDRDYGDSSIIIAAAEINIGRFTPAYFEQIVVDDGDLSGTCNTGKEFAYSGQKDDATNSIGTISYSNNPILEITAYNNQGDITQNYYEDSEGSVNDFMALSDSDVSITAPTLDQVTIGIDPNKLLPLTANMDTGILSQSRGGVLHYQFSDNDNFFYSRDEHSRVRPFISDIDFSIASIEDADGIKATTTVAASPIGVEIRFGRLVLQNSFGPETSDLVQPMQIEYFDGNTFDDNNFVVSTDDNCSSYDKSKIALTNISLDPKFTEALGGTGNFFAGKTREIKLKAPGVGNKGDIRVEYEAYDWLKYNWSKDANGLYDENPTAVATFGFFRGNDRVIYKRRLN
ncbi:MAG: MSHA biogenesis protein MshQ [Moritella dasanensis]|jgi:MSHA biogenesis protein MshQ